MSKVKGALGVQNMSKVRRFFDKVTSTYFNGYLGIFDDCNVEVITNQGKYLKKLERLI
jgi:hypothetical protein